MAVKLNPFLYSILVDLKMNDFTVSEAMDALLREPNEFIDDREARKVVHRLLPIAIKNGLLNRTDEAIEGMKTAIYSKTELFLETVFVARNNKQRINDKNSISKTVSPKFQLEKELFESEIDLHSSIAEAAEYKILQKRLPELADSLQNKYLTVKEKSSRLLGKVNAIKSTIELLKTGTKKC
jgi:hypothetical protein